MTRHGWKEWKQSDGIDRTAYQSRMSMLNDTAAAARNADLFCYCCRGTRITYNEAETTEEMVAS